MVILSFLVAVASGNGAAQAPIHRGRQVAPDAAVRIFNIAGTVRVTGWDRDSVDVTAVVPKGAGEFMFGGGSGGVKMGINPPIGEATYPGSLFEVRVPARARVWIKTESAEILVVGTHGIGGPLERERPDRGHGRRRPALGGIHGRRDRRARQFLAGPPFFGSVSMKQSQNS